MTELERLPIDADSYGGQHDRSKWAQQHAQLEAVFASKCSKPHQDHTCPTQRPSRGKSSNVSRTSE